MLLRGRYWPLMSLKVGFLGRNYKGERGGKRQGEDEKEREERRE